MSIRVSDLFPSTTSVPINGKLVEIIPLNLEQIIQLLTVYRQDITMMFADSVDGNLNLTTLVATAPALVADLIAFGIGAEDQRADVSRLPGYIQVELLAEIWKMSVPDPKKLLALLLGVMAGLQNVGGAQSLETSNTQALTE